MAAEPYKRCTTCGLSTTSPKHTNECDGERFTWAFVVDVGEGGERRQVRRSGFDTKREAEAEMVKLLSTVNVGEYIEPSKTTFGRYLEEWLEATKPPKVKWSTWNGRRQEIKYYVLPYPIANLPVQDVGAVHLDRLYANLLADGRVRGEGGLSPTTVNGVHRILRKAMGDAVRWKIIVKNPVQEADPPSQTEVKARRRRAMTVWTGDQLRTYLDHLAGDELFAMFHTAAFTGLRRSEFLAVPWDDVNLDLAKMYVRWQYIRGEGGPELLEMGKSSTSLRTIDLDPYTVEVLRRHRRDQMEQQLAARRWEDHGLVFTKSDGSPWAPETITRYFRNSLEDVDVPRIRLHDLRHTHATLLLRANVSPHVVSRRLGHSSVAFTLDTYAHVLPDQQADAIGKFLDEVYPTDDEGDEDTEDGAS